MRFNFDRRKNRESKEKHGVSLEEAQEIFDQVYVVDGKNDDPLQFRAIGWCRGLLCSVIFKLRQDADGEYHRLITAWNAMKQEEQIYVESVQEGTHSRGDRGNGDSRGRHLGLLHE